MTRNTHTKHSQPRRRETTNTTRSHTKHHSLKMQYQDPPKAEVGMAGKVAGPQNGSSGRQKCDTCQLQARTAAHHMGVGMSGRGGEEGTAGGSRQTPPMHAIRSNILYTHMYSALDTACAWIDGHVTTRMELAAYILHLHSGVVDHLVVNLWRRSQHQIP